jgi:riboflavin synthase
MFTGIVEALGTVEGIDSDGESVRLRVREPGLVRDLRPGDSVSVSGVCLTVVAREGDAACFDAVRETLLRTSLADLEKGSRVNLERALRAEARLDGHVVQGHVDATGVVERLERSGEDVRLYVACEPEFTELLVPKGSIAVDGVSLTVVGLRERGFDVALVPYTLEHTTLGERRPGERVNLEADVLGKYVKRHVERMLGSRGTPRS